MLSEMMSVSGGRKRSWVQKSSTVRNVCQCEHSTREYTRDKLLRSLESTIRLGRFKNIRIAESYGLKK